jgi:hypothetical protein
LVLPIIVADATGEAEYADAVFLSYAKSKPTEISTPLIAIVEAEPAPAIGRFIVSVVVARDGNERFIEHACNVFEIFVGQISGRKHEVNVGKALAYVTTVDEQVDFVRDAEYADRQFHSTILPNIV